MQAILAARIDRLPPDEKDLLQTLAVIGTEFKLGLVRKVAAKSGPELEPMLSDLQLGEFIYEQPAIRRHRVHLQARADPRSRLQLGAERTPPSSARTNRRRVGIDLCRESRRSRRRAGAPLRAQRQSGKAVEYCLRAVRQCDDRGSIAEAVAQFEIGLEQLQKLPDDDQRAELELDLRIAVVRALLMIKGYGLARMRAVVGARDGALPAARDQLGKDLGGLVESSSST